MSGHEHENEKDMFEPASWEERYAGEERIWSGAANPQLVAEVSGPTPGTALDGVADRTDWSQVDARTFAAAGQTYDLVTTHFLHPPDGGMVAVTRRLAEAVAPGGHLLVVGHAPSEVFAALSEGHHRAMFLAADLLPALPEDFEPLVVEQRPRTVTRDGQRVDIDDSTLLARRRASSPRQRCGPVTTARGG